MSTLVILAPFAIGATCAKSRALRFACAGTLALLLISLGVRNG